MTLVKFNNRPSNLYNDFLSDLLTIPSAWSNEFADSLNFPPTNIHETKDGYEIEMNVPGRNKENFKIEADRDLLFVSFENQEQKEVEDRKSIRKEFSFKNFKRSFRVDDKMDTANIQAKYENGLLKLFIPKKEEVKALPKQITVL